MKIKYKHYIEPEWVEIPFRELKELEPFFMVEHLGSRSNVGSWWQTEPWHINGSTVEPVRASSCWTTYRTFGSYFNKDIVKVLR
jgi:hypothetical protein